jgi:ABC-type branched-subunit amino acid transport system substrate-binding protein/predicted negative regulator of RcsB-dependent stress response
MISRWRKILGICSLTLALLIAGCAGIPLFVKEKPLIRPDEIPKEIQPLYSRAGKAFQKRQMDEALDLYGQIIKQVSAGGPVAIFSHLRRGEIFASKGDHSKAVQELDDIPKRFDGDSLYNEAQYYLAVSYSKLEEYDLSEKIGEKLLSEKLTSQREAEIQSIIGDSLLIKDNAFDALLRYMKALKKNPDKALKSCLKTKVEDITVTRLSIEQLETLNDKYRFGYPSGYILYALAKSYYETNDITKSKEALKQFLTYHEDNPHFGEGMELDQRFAEMEAADRYAVGCILPLTGRFAGYGNMALDAIILASGVFDPEKDNPIKLIIEDSGSDPDTARTAVDKLVIEDKVIGIIGPMGSSTALEAAKEAQKSGVPILTLTQRDGITEIGNYVFRDFLTAAMQVKTLVKYSVQNLGMKSFAILYPEDNYGIEMMNLFWSEVLRYGGQIRGVESYNNKKTDFGKEIKLLTGLNFQEEKTEENEAKPVIDFDALFIPDSHTRVSMIAPQLAFYDVTGIQLLGTNAWNSPKLFKMDSEYIEGAIFVDGFFQNSYYPAVRDFIDSFYVAYGREPTDMDALAYDAASIVVSILRGNDIEIRDDLRDRMLQLKDYQGITGKTSFLENGDVQKFLYVLMVRDNEIIQIN